jgi:putative PIN family toxin of toxin-antitoxin system
VIRAVFDANVIAAGFPAKPGTLEMLINRWFADEFRLVVSDYILDEVENAWAKPYWRARFTTNQVRTALHVLRRDAEVTPITVTIEGIASHPEDDMVLATAVSAEAEYLVTGDRELQDLRSYGQVQIVSPTAFLAILDQQPGSSTPTPQP